MMALEALGARVVILGPSNAGKSTLAVAVGRARGLPVVHLDRLRHVPGTDWEMREDAEFTALHDAAIAQERWVMEGNYSPLMPQRFARATGAIVITSHPWLRFGRYLRRTLVNPADRPGHLDGARDSVKWEMVHWILVRTPGRAATFAERVREAGLPLVTCWSAREVTALYRAWGLERPGR